ncbi:NB-ARC domain-containing protein, partial [Microcoleus sp. herbarium14]|uniref:NB-ARC domain-containing protein n=1 Tax=Microcoleus sp. herbarium14 TaxID=3055439 RepID=UPI002FD01009
MTTEELLHWTDDVVFTKTGKRLDSVQTAILEGAWQRLKYEEIARTCHRSKSHVKNIASELWQTISDVLGEDINKMNVRSILERKAVSNIYNYGESLEIVSSYINSPINICGENRQYAEETQQRDESPQNKNQSPIIDLTEAPELPYFYDRTSELSTLKQWIIQVHTRLITIYGLSGIGKSAIALKLIEQTQTEFDYIIWLSLTNTPTLSTLQTELKQFFGRSPQPPLPT